MERCKSKSTGGFCRPDVPPCILNFILNYLNACELHISAICYAYLSNELHIKVKADAGLAAAASTATEVTLSDELVDDLQRLRELRLWLVDLDLVLVLEEVAAVLLDGLEGVLAVLDLVLQRVVEGDGRDVLDGELA